MDFSKYNSITNHYNLKTFIDLIEHNGEKIPNPLRFQITEKIHGANFSILVENGEIRMAKRTDFVADDENFYGHQDVFANTKYICLFDKLLEVSKKLGKVQLYGELFGGKIQKGVWYGAEKHFRWYALKINNKLVSNAVADELLEDVKLFKVPIIGFDSFDFVNESVSNFIDRIPYKFQSKLTPEGYEGENICEGVVAVPYDIVPVFGDNYFAIKKKTQEFIDKKSKKKFERVAREIPEDVQNLMDEFVSYINEVRTNDLMSKMGELREISDISAYAKEYFKDAMDDFILSYENEWGLLDKSFKKDVTKAGSNAIFAELKNFLAG